MAPALAVCWPRCPNLSIWQRATAWSARKERGAWQDKLTLKRAIDVCRQQWRNNRYFILLVPQGTALRCKGELERMKKWKGVVELVTDRCEFGARTRGRLSALATLLKFRRSWTRDADRITLTIKSINMINI